MCMHDPKGCVSGSPIVTPSAGMTVCLQHSCILCHTLSYILCILCHTPFASFVILPLHPLSCILCILCHTSFASFVCNTAASFVIHSSSRSESWRTFKLITFTRHSFHMPCNGWLHASNPDVARSLYLHCLYFTSMLFKHDAFSGLNFTNILFKQDASHPSIAGLHSALHGSGASPGRCKWSTGRKRFCKLTVTAVDRA